MTKEILDILIINTRPLCYFSAEFFLDRIEESLENLGHRVLRLNLSEDDEDFEVLSDYSGNRFDAVLDINSKLPYLIDEDGDFWLDKIEAPFFNYILDHPLYHHPGLVFPLKNYHAIGIDRYHCLYMEQHYPHLKSVSYLPLAGTEPVSNRAFSEKKNEILFTGTALSDEDVIKEVNTISETFGSFYKEMVFDLVEIWNPNKEPLEVCVERYLKNEIARGEELVNRPFSELMNILYPVDRIKRDKVRKKVISGLKGELPLTVIGEGWGEDSPGMPYANSVELNGKYKCVLDINPGFLRGFHDRTANALAAGDFLISNIPIDNYSESSTNNNLVPDSSFISFSDDDLEALINRFNGISVDEMEEIAVKGYEFYRRYLTWEEHANSLENIICRLEG